MKLCERNLIHSAAHITGGGLIENLIRSIPENLSINIDLSKIKILRIFKWLKSKNISSNEIEVRLLSDPEEYISIKNINGFYCIAKGDSLRLETT